MPGYASLQDVIYFILTQNYEVCDKSGSLSRAAAGNQRPFVARMVSASLCVSEPPCDVPVLSIFFFLFSLCLLHEIFLKFISLCKLP